jgi:hypothetical protein
MFAHLFSSPNFAKKRRTINNLPIEPTTTSSFYKANEKSTKAQTRSSWRVQPRRTKKIQKLKPRSIGFTNHLEPNCHDEHNLKFGLS